MNIFIDVAGSVDVHVIECYSNGCRGDGYVLGWNRNDRLGNGRDVTFYENVLK